MTTELDFDEMPDGPNYPRMIKVSLATVLYLASLGVIIASETALLDSLEGGVDVALVVGAAIMLITITVLWMKELGVGVGGSKDEPVAPSTKKSKLVLLASGALGGFLAFLFYALQSGDGPDVEMFSNAPIAPEIAIGLSLLFLVGMIYSSLQWQKTTDEHEHAAVATGLYAAVAFYSVATPIWWMGQRASLLPEQDPMIMFVLVMAVMSAAWTYKRGA